MKCQIKIIKPWPIWHFDFESQYDLTSTFVRIQEHYESPRKIHRESRFTLDQYMDWYVKKYGSWDYFEKWDGFNIPDQCIKSFFTLFKGDLRDKEKWILNRLKRFKTWPGITSNEPYCIIATFQGDKKILLHELRHALFYLDEDYRNKVILAIRKYSINKFKKELLKDGYCKEVVIDEINAYAISGWLEGEATKEMEELAKELKQIEREHFNGEIQSALGA